MEERNDGPSLVQQNKISTLPNTSTASATAAWHCPIDLHLNQPLFSPSALLAQCSPGPALQPLHSAPRDAHLTSNRTTLNLSLHSPPGPLFRATSCKSSPNSAALSSFPSDSPGSIPATTKSPCASTCLASAMAIGESPEVKNHTRGALWVGKRGGGVGGVGIVMVWRRGVQSWLVLCAAGGIVRGTPRPLLSLRG